MGASATCIDDQSAAIKAMEAKINAETGEYNRLRAIDDAEMTVRKNDLAVGEFIMRVTQCKAKGGPMGLVQTESDAENNDALEMEDYCDGERLIDGGVPRAG